MDKAKLIEIAWDIIRSRHLIDTYNEAFFVDDVRRLFPHYEEKDILATLNITFKDLFFSKEYDNG